MAPRELEVFWERHWGDSLRGSAVLETDSIIDFGSGGGFPAIPLALGIPELKVVCVEKVAKKRAFLQEASRELGLKSRIRVVSSLEEAVGEAENITLTMRAVSLDDCAKTIRELERRTGKKRTWLLYYWGKVDGETKDWKVELAENKVGITRLSFQNK